MTQRLLNNFYTISNYEHSDNSIRADVSFNAAHPVFEGHFPSQPVVPGVSMLQLIKDLFVQSDAAYATAPVHVQHVAQIKFLQFVTPDMQLKADIRYIADAEQNNTYLITAALLNADAKPVLKANATFIVT